MKIIEYYLLPESGYTGKYDRKEAHYMVKSGTIAEMIHDSGMLCGYDFDNSFHIGVKNKWGNNGTICESDKEKKSG